MRKPFIILLFLLFLTGCGKKQKLECIIDSNELTTEIVFNYNNNKINSIYLKYIYNLEKYDDKNMESFEKQNYCTIVDESSDIFKGAIKKCSQDINNKTLSVDAEININKINSNSFNKDSSINNVKNNFEQSGAFCEIKK